MLGWHIIIKQKSPEECDNAAIPEQGVLASWEVGLYGLTWLKELVKAGRAEQIFDNRNGYPLRYRALAKDVLPLIVEGHPPYKPSNTIGEGHFTTGARVAKLQINKEKIAQCPVDFLLTIDAWDLS